MNDYTQRKIIGWTFALVLALGIVEIKMFLMPPTTVVKAIALAHKARLPAGLAPIKTTESKNLLDVSSEILDYKLPCKRKLTPIDAGDSRQIRFHFEVCAGVEEDYRIASIVNETNSYQGTIFSLDEFHQTSDFIPLKEGSNHIKLVFTNKDQQKSEQEYVFNRNVLKK